MNLVNFHLQNASQVDRMLSPCCAGSVPWQWKNVSGIDMSVDASGCWSGIWETVKGGMGIHY